jgi:serine/threonine protein phosphatase PrpC
MLEDPLYISHISNWEQEDYIEKLASHIIDDAKFAALTMFRLPYNCLDATLLIAIWDHDKKKGKALCYGDGSVIWKTKNDTLNFINLSYESNAPYYLSYKLEESRREDYIKAYGDKDLILMEHVGYEINRNIHKYDKYCEFTFDDSTTMLAIASDGLSSFEKNKTSIDISTIIDPFFAFKNVNGEYLKRRADKYIKELNKDGFTHFDDISIACINIKD